MAFEHSDYTELKKEFDERYVLQSTCDDVQRETSKKFANDDKRIDKLIDMMRIWNKLLWAIASAGIGTAVTALLQLIFK